MAKVPPFITRPKKRQTVPRAQLIEALSDAAAHLVGAASAYKTYAGNSERPGKRDALYNTRSKDFDAACKRARATLLKVKGGG